MQTRNHVTLNTWYRCTCDELDHIERKWWKPWAVKVYWKRNPDCRFHGDTALGDTHES